MKIHLFVLIVNFSNMVSNLNFDLQPLYLQGITEEVGGDKGGLSISECPPISILVIRCKNKPNFN